MADEFKRQEQLEHLGDVCRTLEDEAGLSKAMERAREGRFIPLGALGEKVTPDEYFADEHDHLRRKTRDAYFSVQDLGLRKKLIAADRAVDSFRQRTLQEDIVEASRAVSWAKAKTEQLPWTKAALAGVAAVTIGYWVFGLVGAIACAVGGYFLGQGIVTAARNEANAVLDQALSGLQELQKEKAERALMPECFSHQEEMSGNRNTLIDGESAYFNVLQKDK